MRVAGYQALERSHLVRDFEAVFRQATGMWVKLVPRACATASRRRGTAENPFCTMVAGSARGGPVCLRAEAALQRSAGRKLKPQVCRCFAGFSVVAVPVVAGGDHVATLVAGQVFRQKPTRSQVSRLVRLLGQWGYNGELRSVKQAYLRTPVLSQQHFHANLQLLRIFARSLADYASRGLIARNEEEPPAVRQAKEFAQQHAHERVTMRDAARHVHLSPFYFCKTFKKATGITFTQCVARLRVEKAKSLLLNPFMRVTEVAYSSGFQSIPHFNTVFKTYVGKSPTAYRESVRREFAI